MCFISRITLFAWTALLLAACSSPGMQSSDETGPQASPPTSMQGQAIGHDDHDRSGGGGGGGM